MPRRKYRALYSGHRYDTYEEAVADNASWRLAKRLKEQTDAIKPTYIGGSPIQSRAKFWAQEPIVAHAVDSVANLYGINPVLLKARLDHEGFTDAAIQKQNSYITSGKVSSIPRGYDLLSSTRFNGANDFGTDDIATYIENGSIKLNNKKRWYNTGIREIYEKPENMYSSRWSQNEHQRDINYAQGWDVADNMGLTAAGLKMFRDIAAKDFPNASNSELDRYAAAYYNRGVVGGKQWVKRGANPNEYRINKRFGGRVTFKNGGRWTKLLSNILHNTGGNHLTVNTRYTGSYKYGEPDIKHRNTGVNHKYLYAGNAADNNRDLVSLYLGEDTIGVKKLRRDKYVLGDKSYDADFFEGKILPIKKDGKPYSVRPEMKDYFDGLIENDRTFRLNLENIEFDEDTFGKQTLDNVRHAVAKPIKGKDGKYYLRVSKYWDLAGSLPGGRIIDWANPGNPFVLEQTIPLDFDDTYTKENYILNNAIRNKRQYGGRISLKHGGIHINPANRGKFTATMKRTGKTASQLAHSKNPLTRKRAIFALNARKWKH